MIPLKLPSLDRKIGLPQRQFVTIPIKGTVVGFEFLFRVNPNMELIIMDVRRITDRKLVYSSAISQDIPFEVREPITKSVLFTMWPREIIRDLSSFEILVFTET